MARAEAENEKRGGSKGDEEKGEEQEGKEEKDGGEGEDRHEFSGKRSITESRTDVLMEHVKATNNNGRFRLKRSSGRRNSRA